MSAGYSGTPLPKKLGIQEGARVALLDAPERFSLALPAEATCHDSLRGRARFDVILVFVRRLSDLRKRFVQAAGRLQPNGGLWIAWPKKSSGVETDVGEALVREHGLDEGLVDNKICAIDETWSGLRFVIRLVDR